MHFLNINDFSKEEIENFIKYISLVKNKRIFTNHNLNNEFVANIFLEPSTRTLNSFIKAEYELKMPFININNVTSSLKKNETLYDTVINLREQGFKTFIIRAYDEFYISLKSIKGINLINAGDGSINHPSQALLDLYTIHEYCLENNKKLTDIKMLIVGDLKNSRVYKSNKLLLEKMGLKVDTFSPKEFSDGSTNSISDLSEINKYDIVMLLRIQHERHENKFKLSCDEYNKKYGLNSANIKFLKKDAIFMHPGPINLGTEITKDIAYSDKSWILRQVENGVYTRIAILLYVLGKNK